MLEVAQKDEMIQALSRLKDFPTVLDKEDNDFYQCPFCQQMGFFATGNGSIAHTTECALALAHRLANTRNWNTFDDLALNSIVHQLAQVKAYPQMKNPDKSEEWVEFCPFCQRLLNAKSILFHAPDCIILQARSLEYLASKRKGRIEYLRSFAWERVSNEFLQEIADFLCERGFDGIG
jgi:hypothetical protein